MMLPIRSNAAPLWRQQLAALWANTSPLVKCISLVIVLGYALSYVDGAVAALSVTPGKLVPPAFHVWTALTFWCLEMHAWEVCVDILTVALCGKLIEPLWGRWELVAFFWVVNVGVALLSTLVYVLRFAATGDTDTMFQVHVHGLAGYVAGLAVAVRQIMPDLLIVRTGAIKFTNRNVPLTMLTLGSLLWAIGLLDSTFPVMFASGLFVSWTYLRFYQRHGPNSRGDSSDSFSFASFFPNVLQPPIECLATPIHILCVRIGLVRRQQQHHHHPLTQVRAHGHSSGHHSLAGPGNPGLSDPQNIERRRQIALKALNERLSKNTDSARQNVLPKSLPNEATPTVPMSHAELTSHPRFPVPVQGDGRRVPFTFEIPAIPLPPPPSAASSAAGASASPAKAPANSATIVDLLE